jgi:hypothetical protein
MVLALACLVSLLSQSGLVTPWDLNILFPDAKAIRYVRPIERAHKQLFERADKWNSGSPTNKVARCSA